ncbi:36905_t:CDS:2, partial [Racocetra persica]
PTAEDIHNKLSGWSMIVYNNAAYDNHELAILKAFQSADAIIPTLSTEIPTFHKDKLTTPSKKART